MWILSATFISDGEVVLPRHPALPGVGREGDTTLGISALLSANREKAGHHPVFAFSQCLLLKIVLMQSGVFWGWHRPLLCGMSAWMYCKPASV